MDVTNRVVTTFRHDTSQATAAVKHLRGVEREEAKKTLAALEQSNAKLESQLGLLTKIGAGVGLAYGAWRVAGAAVTAHLEDLRLEAAAAGANIDSLKEATRGLVETDNLLAFAGKAMHGVWKLNQAEMETVLKGTDALAKGMGLDMKTAVDAVTDAVTKGSTRALKELGVEVKDKADLLRQFAGAAQHAGEGGETAAEKWQQATVKWADAVDDVKGKLGSVAIEMAPVISAFADLATELMAVADAIKEVSGGMEGVLQMLGGGPGSALSDALAAGMDQQGRSWGSGSREFGSGRGLVGSGGGPDTFSLQSLHEGTFDPGADQLLAGGAASVARTVMEWGARAAAELTAKKAKEKSFTLDTQEVEGVDTSQYMKPGLGGSLGGPGAIDGATGGHAGLGGPEADAASYAKFKQDMQDISNIAAGINENMAGRPTILEQIFGKPDDITAMSVAIGVASDAVNGLTNAIAASFEAAVTGSDSAVDAFKKVAAGAVHAIGKELAVVGAKELVYAAVELAKGNFAGAGLHTAASVAAFAGSAVAFKVASEMGYGAAGASGAAAAGGAGIRAGSTGRGGGDPGRGERTTVIALGRDFGMLNDLEQRQLLHRAIRMGLADDDSTKRIRDE